MENRDQKQEIHGVHICSKCGWPFPNPHPSAKHRRAHKKVCGKIEGFKSAESEGSTHLALSDDDRVAEDDHKISSPKTLESACNVKGIDGIGSKSKEYEIEVFSDAVAEFSESSVDVGINKPSGDAPNSITATKTVAKDEMSSSETSKDTETVDLVPSPSNTAANREVDNSNGAESTIDHSETERESKLNQESMKVETDFRNCESVVILGDHMNSTTGDLYPIEPETVIAASQQEWNINSAENVPQRSFASPDRRNDEKENGSFSSDRNLPEITEPSRKIDESESMPKMEEASELSEVKSLDSAKILLDPGKEVQCCSSNNLVETNEIKERFENVVDHHEAVGKDFDDQKEVKSISITEQDACEGVDGSEGNFKDPIFEERDSTFQEKPFNQTSEVASIDAQMVENKKKQGSGCQEVSLEGEDDCSKNSDQKYDDIPVREVDEAQIRGVLSENEKQDQFQTLSSEVLTTVPSQNSSLDNSTENVAEFLSGENSMDASIGNEMNPSSGKVGTGYDKTGACEVDGNGVSEKNKSDYPDIIAGVEPLKGPLDETLPKEINSLPESSTDSRTNKCHTVAEELADESPMKLSGTETTDSRQFNVGSGLGTPRSKVITDDKSCDIHNFNSVEKTAEDHTKKEANLVSVNSESVEKSAVSQDREFVEDTGGVISETRREEGEKNNVKLQFLSSMIDVSADSSSLTDSLEGNWGSVSVLSTLSDLPAIADAEAKPLAIPEYGETSLKKAELTTKRQHSDKSDLFEPPSFMTLVEPCGGAVQNSAALEIQTAQNQQPNPAPLQAGWFPSYTHSATDSPGRKKNEAIIAKVTNWSTGKPHTALKNLLDDAALENNKHKSPKQEENSASGVQKGEKMAKDGTVMRPRSPLSESENNEAAKEWNSPARYPSDIRREKRKGKPYWAQFVCCSSVH